MDIPRLAALNKYWEDMPPANHSLIRIKLLLEGFFGIETKKEGDSGNYDELIAKFGEMGIAPNVK